MSAIFISYAREDRDKAKALAELCQQQDWSVWWDRRIPPGRSFDEVIEEALGAAKCVVVLWSKSSASSDWVKGEAAEGLRRKILVPVRIDSANVPLEFRRLQTIDLSDWKGEAGHLELGGFLEAVAANIKGVVQRPPSEGSQRKLMKLVLTVLAIVALLAAGFAFYKFAGDRATAAKKKQLQQNHDLLLQQTPTPTPVTSSPTPTPVTSSPTPTPATPSPTPTPASRKPWSIRAPKGEKHERPHVVFQGRAGTRYTIWYDEGDGDAVGIANSTALNPRLHNLIPLAKGTSSEYTIESGSELGIYLRKGTYARGHIQERR